PTVDADGLVDKAGFDLTDPYGVPDTIERRRPRAPRFNGARRFESAQDALAAGPLFFSQVMPALGSAGRRETAPERPALSERGLLTRLHDGEWALKEQPAKKG